MFKVKSRSIIEIVKSVPISNIDFRMTSRSSHERCSTNKGFLRKIAKMTGKHLCQSLLFNKVEGLRSATLLKRDSGTVVFVWSNIEISNIDIRMTSRSSHERCSQIKVFSEKSQKWQENICARVSFLIKLKASGLQLYWKETLAQLFSSEFCKISKNTIFTEHLWWLLLDVSYFVVTLNIITLDVVMNSNYNLLTANRQILT